MVLFLVNRIMNGYLHFWEIKKTHVLRDDVKRVLIEEGLERLIIEDKPQE